VRCRGVFFAHNDSVINSVISPNIHIIIVLSKNRKKIW
jgi:hypothetical protein